ncbi:EAL domain-containing protein [Paracidovorax citrulli]
MSDEAGEADEAIAAGLRLALQSGAGLSLRYQPIVRTADQQMIGVEALLSWETPEGRCMEPHTFFPVADRHGLTIALGEWVLTTACTQIHALHRRHGVALPVNINVSPLHLMQHGFVPWLKETLQGSGLSPRCLTIELTEGSRLEVNAAAVARVRELRELGIGLALDDFGTGYSGLGYLIRLPLDKLKIDQSFIASIDEGQEDGAAASRIVVRSIIELGHQLSLQVVAEGVERVGQLDFLRQHGCDAVQGFLFASGLDLDRLDALCGGSAQLPSP